MLHRLLLCALTGALFASAAACGPNPPGKVPTTIPLATFQPADADELFPDESDDDDTDADAGEGAE